MRYVIEDKQYHFKSAFDTETGAYMRTGILDELGRDTGVDPFMASFPHLIDVGVMGHCIHGKTGLCAKAGIGCFQSGLTVTQPNMTLEDFRWIAEQCRGRCNQLALGGRGDPDQHENFVELLRISRENNLVPNFTTSGYAMTAELAAICEKYCGAVAVSWYRNEYTLNAIQMLLDAGVKTNIHYVLGRNSIVNLVNAREMINGVEYRLEEKLRKNEKDILSDIETVELDCGEEGWGEAFGDVGFEDAYCRLLEEAGDDEEPEAIRIHKCFRFSKKDGEAFEEKYTYIPAGEESENY